MIQPADIIRYFAEYGWNATPAENSVWQASFAGDHATFTVNVLLSPDWISFSIDLISGQNMWPAGLRAEDLLAANNWLRLVKFALTSDNTLRLQTELPTEGFLYSHFVDCLGALSQYADWFAGNIGETK